MRPVSCSTTVRSLVRAAAISSSHRGGARPSAPHRQGKGHDQGGGACETPGQDPGDHAGTLDGGRGGGRRARRAARTVEAASSWSAVSGAAASVARVSGSVLPSARWISPLTSAHLRRGGARASTGAAARARARRPRGGERGLCAQPLGAGDVCRQHREGTPGERRTRDRSGNARRTSSRLYAGTRKAPTAMNASSQSVVRVATRRAERGRGADADDGERHESRRGIVVASGRPFSSSRAWAPTPIASANATTVRPSRPHGTDGARRPPTTTYERCHAV